jgi:hypothetical protein
MALASFGDKGKDYFGTGKKIQRKILLKKNSMTF